jgi:hypothetical protein
MNLNTCVAWKDREAESETQAKTQRHREWMGNNIRMYFNLTEFSQLTVSPLRTKDWSVKLRHLTIVRLPLMVK